MAETAYQDMLKNFWQGNAETGHIKSGMWTYPYQQNASQDTIWDHAMMLFAMDTLYTLNGDEEIKTRIAADWNFIKRNFSLGRLTGMFGNAPNIAVDDTGWNALALMMFYRYTGDEYALRAAGQLMHGAYDYYKDGDTKNGLWYPQVPPSQGGDATTRFKSLYAVALMLATFDYCELVQDEALWQDMMNVYNWTETNLKRTGQNYGEGFPKCDDKLYYCDFNVDRVGRTETYGPDGGKRPNDIGEAGSVGHLGCNMAMAALNAKLYKKTGDEVYLTRATETMHAITDGLYNNNGIYLNDRDAWTSGTFTKVWVEEVLTLPGARSEDKERMFNTARSISEKARTADGYYSGSWTGSGKWERIGSVPQQIMTTGSSVNFIMGAALLESIS